MIYVALLRGINVGGNCKVEMKTLKKTFELVGCKNVLTYINSGNVIFEDSRNEKKLKKIVEKEIEKEFGFFVPIVLRTKENISKLCKKIPENWTNDAKQKTDVMFLWDEIDNKEILEKISIKPELEKVMYLDRALVWNIGRENVTKGNGIKLIKSQIYKQMTVRNINTVRKIESIMQNYE